MIQNDTTYLFTASFVCKNTCATYISTENDDELFNYKWLNTINFLTIHIFRKYVS